jgi:RNA polymerase sigma factor for flagellar operon FliA
MPIAIGEGARRFGHAHPRDTTPPEVVADWQQYKSTGSVRSRNNLVGFYMKSFVRPIAAKVHAGLPRQVDVDDLVQQGYLGLVKAMDRFDLARDVRFETFARSAVFGAIQDWLRAIDPVPRLARQRAKAMQAAGERFRKQHGRPPSDEELRPMLDLPEATFQRVVTEGPPAAMVPFSHVQPDDATGDEGDAMSGFEDRLQPGPVVGVQRRDLQRWVTGGFDQRDRLIVILYYYEQMTMVEIGRALGISESRVSQRLDSILNRLRSRLVATGAEDEFAVWSAP